MALQIRQSDLKTWSKCPLQWRFANIDHLPREQSCALTFGSVLHDAVCWMEEQQDLPGGLARFRQHWTSPESLDPTYAIDFFLPRRSWQRYLQDGERMLKAWWDIIQWDSDVVLAREYAFTVPCGDHELTGTIDKLALRYDPKLDAQKLLVSDYKSNMRMPTYDYISEDIQFSAYCFATTVDCFWDGMGNKGRAYREAYRELPRAGEWVHLRGPQRRDAGVREERHYERLKYAVDAMAQAVAMRIFVPNISGENCLYCEFRKPCGLPEIMRAVA